MNKIIKKIAAILFVLAVIVTGLLEACFAAGYTIKMLPESLTDAQKGTVGLVVILAFILGLVVIYLIAERNDKKRRVKATGDNMRAA